MQLQDNDIHRGTSFKRGRREPMAIEYTIDHERSVILETWLGAVTAQELANHWRRLLVDPDALAIRRTLVDLRNCTIEFTGSDLASMVTSVAVPLLAGRDWKSALLIEKTVHFGVSRQYQVFAENYSQDAIFYDEEDAMRWLLSQASPEPERS